MEARSLTPRYSVSPQISVEDVPAIVAAGFTTVICNRPDVEVPPSHQAASLQAAVESAGLAFHVLPLTHQTMTEDNVAAQRSFLDEASGPVLAYCASGTRSSVIWALAEAKTSPAEDVLMTTMKAGYDLSGLRGRLDQIAAGDS